MSKLIIISNRLPVMVSKSEDGIEYNESIGGLATGLKTCHEHRDSIWLGWPGIADDTLEDDDKAKIEKELGSKYKCKPIFLSQEEVDQYYFAFSNETIWPLFHYFPRQTNYDWDTWSYYKQVNIKFFLELSSIIESGDEIWIHDYQLMLLPGIIRKEYPDAKVGFFLHIPFPSFEIFRELPWREEILEGLLGADLIGFHTYDYVRHFLSSTRRLTGCEYKLNTVTYDERAVKVDAFPMGIDFKRFSGELKQEQISEEVREKLADKKDDIKVIFSVDRLDYSKGIPERLKAFRELLTRYPEKREHVKLNLVVAPSRVEIHNYEMLLHEINELVSDINSTFGTLNWMPIWFLFRSFSQEDMIAFYRHSDVLLVTSLRDGMNLVAKEYVSARTDREGMVVISETAGAASELAEAVIVNPNDIDSIVEGINTALEMPEYEKKNRNSLMINRLAHYTVDYWAKDFLSELDKTTESNEMTVKAKKIRLEIEDEVTPFLKAYNDSKKRLILLDYDGTLVEFKDIPEQAMPDNELKKCLTELTTDERNTVFIITGRDRDIVDKWFSDIKGMNFAASHGLWVKYYGEPWIMTAALDNEWKASIEPVMEMYIDRMPGAFIEKKEFSISLHFRQCDPDLVDMKLNEIRPALAAMIESSPLMIQEGSKVLEIKDSRFSKGNVGSLIIEGHNSDYIFAAGDDLTDENLFEALPENAYSVKVGSGKTAAKYRINSWLSLRQLLGLMISKDRENK